MCKTCGYEALSVYVENAAGCLYVSSLYLSDCAPFSMSLSFFLSVIVGRTSYPADEERECGSPTEVVPSGEDL